MPCGCRIRTSDEVHPSMEVEMVPCNLTLMGIEAVTKVEGALSVYLTPLPSLAQVLALREPFRVS